MNGVLNQMDAPIWNAMVLTKSFESKKLMKKQKNDQVDM